MNILTILLSVAFGITGITKLAGIQQMKDQFGTFELSESLVFVIGFFELAGAIGLQLGGFTALAAIGLACIMAGAVFFHLKYEGVGPAIPAFILGLLSMYVATQTWPSSVFA